MTPKQTREHASRLARLRISVPAYEEAIRAAAVQLQLAKDHHAALTRNFEALRDALATEEVYPDIARLSVELRMALFAVQRDSRAAKKSDCIALARRGLAAKNHDHGSFRPDPYKLTPKGRLVVAALRRGTTPAPGPVPEEAP